MKLELGNNARFEQRYYCMKGPVQEPLRVLYLSDLHFGRRSAAMADSLISAIEGQQPDVLLLGGDYVDSRAGLSHLERLLQSVSFVPRILAVAGNHDRFFGLERIRNIMQQQGVQWIDGKSLRFELRQTRVRIDGNSSAGSGEDGELRILCFHKPEDPARFPVSYHLAFAGHLHGSQCVLWKNEKGLFPGRWFYRWNVLEARVEHCHYYISKGLGDTLPLRYNCPKDLLVVDIEPQ